jgi:hypothetical protein
MSRASLHDSTILGIGKGPLDHHQTTPRSTSMVHNEIELQKENDFLAQRLEQLSKEIVRLGHFRELESTYY